MVTAPETAKGNGFHLELPDLSHHINSSTRARQPNMLKKMYPYLLDPNIVSLGGGLPHSSTFPILKASFELPVPPNFDGTPYDASARSNGSHSTSYGRTTNGYNQSSHQDAHDRKQAETAGRTTMKFYKGRGPKGEHAALDLAQAQQYSRPTGFEPLRDPLRRLTTLLHDPPYAFHQIPTGGNTDATTKVFKALLEADDTLLVEEFEFAPPMNSAKALGAGIKGVQIDTLGIVPHALDELLSGWDASKKGKKPHVLYTVPTGQNPTSATLTLERAQAVYAVAQKHDLVIVEDDPYYWLVLEPYVGPAAGEASSTAVEEGRVSLKDVRNLDDFARSLPRSYLSLDTDGRVIRLDSFSKCFAPGMRTGWMTGNEHFLERMQRIAETDSQEINGISQAFFAQLLSEPSANLTNESWGLEGFARWICDLRKQYSAKRDRLVNGIVAHCKAEHVKCHPVAQSGMFLWLEVQLKNHPDYRFDDSATSTGGARTNTTELIQRCFEMCIEEGVLVLQSGIFAATPALPRDFQPAEAKAVAAAIRDEQAQLADKACFLRACYAGNLEQLDLAAARLGKALNGFFDKA